MALSDLGLVEKCVLRVDGCGFGARGFLREPNTP